jgi:glutamate racemase
MEPAIKPAAARTRTGVVGVLATAGTLKADKYLSTRVRWGDNIQVVEHVGQGFVELVESGKTDGSEAEEVVETSVEPLLDAGADTIVLGCTHYPFLADTIRLVASRLVPDREITIIDPAPAVAKHLLDVMTEEGISPADANGYALELIASGDSGTLTTIAGNI